MVAFRSGNKLIAHRHDAAGVRTSVLKADGSRVTWTYDEAYQLTREQIGASGATYTYDAVGNRLSRIDQDLGVTDYAYDGANQTTSLVGGEIGDSDFAYDAAGNLALATLGPTTYTWDGDNRLVGFVTHPFLGPRITHTYDADGRRVKVQIPTSATKFVWDQENVLLETNAADATQAVYTLEPDMYGRLVSQNRSGTRRYCLFDALGTTDRLLDASQLVTDTFSFRAFGDFNLSLGNPASNPVPFRWLGQYGYYRDGRLFAELYVRARFYSPLLGGRWLSRDPVQDDWNLYRYVRNNPAVLVDPTGKAETEIRCYLQLCDMMKKIYDKWKKDPGKEKDKFGCVRIPYKDFKDQATLDKYQLSLVDWGCVGLTILALADAQTQKIYRFPDDQDKIGPPHDIPTALCHFDKKEVYDYKCREGEHKIVFAYQAAWKGGKKPELPRGRIRPMDYLEPKTPGDFDYTIECEGGFTFGATKSAYLPDGTLDPSRLEIVLCPDAKRVEQRTEWGTVWCVFCRSCKIK